LFGIDAFVGLFPVHFGAVVALLFEEFVFLVDAAVDAVEVVECDFDDVLQVFDLLDALLVLVEVVHALEVVPAAA